MTKIENNTLLIYYYLVFKMDIDEEHKIELDDYKSSEKKITHLISKIIQKYLAMISR